MKRACGGLAGLNEHRPGSGIFSQRIINLLRTHATAPFDLDFMRNRAMGDNQLTPAFAKFAAVDVNRMMIRVEQINDRRLHRTGTARRQQNYLLTGSKERL